MYIINLYTSLSLFLIISFYCNQSSYLVLQIKRVLRLSWFQYSVYYQSFLEIVLWLLFCHLYCSDTPPDLQNSFTGTYVTGGYSFWWVNSDFISFKTGNIEDSKTLSEIYHLSRYNRYWRPRYIRTQSLFYYWQYLNIPWFEEYSVTCTPDHNIVIAEQPIWRLF